MKETVLVTGAAGFTGRYLCDILRQDNACEVVRSSRRSVSGFEICDLENGAQVNEMVGRIVPSKIYHCAGTFSNCWETDISINVEASRNIMEAVAEHSPQTRVLLIGSAAEYGPGKIGAISEESCLNPLSVYGITKAMQTFLMNLYVKTRNLDIVLARAFNLYGDGISPELFPGRVQQQIDAVREGEKEYVEVRSLHSSRDYIHVKEAVAAYVRIMNHGERGEAYNVGSGSPTPISELMARMLKGTGVGMEAVRATQEEACVDEPVSFANIEKYSRLPHSEE